MVETDILHEKRYKVYDLEEVLQHSNENDCWVVDGKDVYDITSFLDKHPGGAELILREAGTDVSRVLRDINVHIHTANAFTILKEYKIGEINVDNDHVVSNDFLDINGNELVGFKEDLVDWNRGMVMQVHKFGHDYVKWVHTPVMKKLRMFDNPFIEYLTITSWYVIPMIYIPMSIAFAACGYMRLSEKTLPEQGGENHSLQLTAGICFLIGVFLWTLAEYVIHRYIFHLEPNGDSAIQITIHFTIHGNHHKVPFDEGRLVFPPALSLLLLIGFWYLFTLLPFFPDGINALVLSGTIAGYMCYDLIHYYVHHGNPSKDSYLHGLKHYHVRHHFVDSEEGFGVSTKFWDKVFDNGKRKFM